MAVTYVRTSITLPPELVDAADRRARELDRSRSWVIAEALRRYVADPGDRAAGAVAGRVSEAVMPYMARRPGLGEYRQVQLEADMALTPEERVRTAEATARVGELSRATGRREQVLAFERYEDYLDWKRREDVRP